MICDVLGNCKGFAMLLETLNAEQFRVDRFLDVSRERCGWASFGPQEYKIQTYLSGPAAQRGRAQNSWFI